MPGPSRCSRRTAPTGGASWSARRRRRARRAGSTRRGARTRRASGWSAPPAAVWPWEGASLCELGNADGVNDLREAVRMGLELGLGEETALAYGNLAYQLWLRESPAESLAVWQKAAEFAQQRGFEMQAMWSRNGQLEAL